MSVTRTLDLPGAPPPFFSPAGLPSRARGKGLGSIRVSSPPVEIAGIAGSASSVESKMSEWPKSGRLSLVMIAEGGPPVSINDIPFQISVAHTGEITLSSKELETPWKFLISIAPDLKQMSVTITLDYAGLSIDEALAASTFNAAIATGGKLQIYGRHPLTGGDLPIASAALPSGAYPCPDARLMEMLEQLAFIERRTGVTFSIPEDDITHEAVNTIANTVHILQTGRAEYEAQPWVSVSPVEQAKSALETFASGHPVPTAIHFAGEVVVIFGTPVMLGPVTLFCQRTYVTAEDLEDLRKQLQNTTDDSNIKIRLTPFENCPIEARYVNWLPGDEAQALRQLPMYQHDDLTYSEDSWTLPNADVAKAVSLLESWYEEDAEEQEASWKLIKSALDRDRISDRKLFG